jgi:hypothetical protein
MNAIENIWHNHEPTTGFAGNRGNRLFDPGSVAHRHGYRFDTQGCCSCLKRTQVIQPAPRRGLRVENAMDPRESGRDLLQQINPLSRE